jgi:hypothetical protein
VPSFTVGKRSVKAPFADAVVHLVAEPFAVTTTRTC